MSSIPVRRTTRTTRSAKDTENANARPTRLTTRAKTIGGGGTGSATTATAATTRAMASTAASKAKAVAAGATEAAGVKRKREVLVEVTGLVTNNKGKETAKGPSGLKGKGKEEDVTVIKPKNVVKPTRVAGRTVAGVALRRVVRATSESTTTSKTETEVESKPPLLRTHDVHEKMEIDEPELPPPSAEPSSVASVASRAKHVEDEEVGRVFKKRHTDEKPTLLKETQIHDESQADADKVAAELEPEQTSASAQLWDDLDAEDWDDPVMVSEYVVDVCVYLKELELATLPNPDYMNEQNEITWEHRGVLIDWLLQVHARFSLNSESLFLTVNVLDRFLGMRSISISKLQLVGLASFFIATKFEETYAPSVKEIAYLADDQYTVEEILKAERYILKSIEWDLRAPGPLGWLRRASKADECEVHARTIAKYLIEIGLLEHKMIGVVSSKVSAAALWLARMTLGREEWTANLEHYTTFSEKELLPVANMMLEYIIIDPVPHDSLYKKYAHKKYFRCSTYMSQWALDRWPENSTVDLSKDLVDIKDEIRKHREQEERAAAAGESRAAAP